MAQTIKVGVLWRFLTAGGPGVFLYYVIFYGLTELGVWYMLAAFLAWLVNWSCNFYLQKYWVFRNQDPKAAKQQAASYLSMAVGLLVGNLVMLFVLVEFAGRGRMAAQVVSTIILTIISFLITSRIFGGQANASSRVDQ